MDISDIRLKTHDLPAVRGYYADSLGLTILYETENSVTFDAGATRLTFEQDEDENEYHYHFAFNIPNNQFSDAKAWLVQRAQILPYDGTDEVEHENMNARAVYFCDAVGNVVELIARFSVDNDSDIPFSPQSILRVSEIGLAVRNPREVVSQLVDELGVPVMIGPDDDFNAVGDARGLFIIVKRGRVWVPTEDVEAQKAPLSITLRGDRDVEFTIPKTDYVIKMSRM